jgi:hypothetical protein
MKIEYGTNEESWQKIHSYIAQERSKNPNFSVIDIGGTMHGHSANIANMIVDINCIPDNRNINIDICDETQWARLQEIVDRQGKYDFAICTHTLEDLYNPITALKWMPRIAKTGVITMPSLSTELSRHEYGDNCPWLGYIHHRWIFDQEDGKMLVIPKITYLENLLGQGMVYDISKYEVRYTWENEIPYKLFMDNFLGPTSGHVIAAYKNLTQR